jgi:hypothetical protein
MTLTACSGGASSGPLTQAMLDQTFRDCGVAGKYSAQMPADGGKPVINMGTMILDRANDAAVAENTTCVVGALTSQGYAPDRDFTFAVVDMRLPPDAEARIAAGQPLR